MTMKNDAKSEEELTCHFNIIMRNLTNFDLSSWKSQKLALLMGFFWTKYITFELKKVQRSNFWWHWRVMQERFICGLENNMKNLANFYQSTRRSQNWDFDRILLSKIKKRMNLKFKEELCVMTMRVMWNL